MELKKFIAQTLLDIVQGVEDAQEKAAEEGTAGRIAPYSTTDTTRGVREIDFDVAITSAEGAEAGAGISVVGIGAKGSLSTERSNVSRIKFSVPITLPKKIK